MGFQRVFCGALTTRLCGFCGVSLTWRVLLLFSVDVKTSSACSDMIVTWLINIGRSKVVMLDIFFFCAKNDIALSLPKRNRAMGTWREAPCQSSQPSTEKRKEKKTEQWAHGEENHASQVSPAPKKKKKKPNKQKPNMHGLTD